jgi:hypothetical protein
MKFCTYLRDKTLIIEIKLSSSPSIVPHSTTLDFIGEDEAWKLEKADSKSNCLPFPLFGYFLDKQVTTSLISVSHLALSINLVTLIMKSCPFSYCLFL